MKHILSIIHFVPKILLRKLQKRGVYALLCSANNGFGKDMEGRMV